MKSDEILKVTDKEVLVERLKQKDVRKVERRLLKRQIARMKPKRKPRVKKIKAEDIVV